MIFLSLLVWWTWPDRDDDGLPDHWETQGVWVGDKRVDLPGLGADPNRKDAFVYADRVSGERWNDSIKERVRTAFRASPLNIETHFVDGARVLARSEVPTRVIESDEFFAEVTKRQFAATGLGGAPGSVPALAKYVCVCADYYDDSATSTTFGVANGIKLTRMGPVDEYDMVRGGMTSADPTIVALREELFSLQPACLISHHSYLWSVPFLVDP